MNNYPVIGVVGDIYNRVIYSSMSEKGTFKNSEKMYVSEIDEIEKATLATGFPSASNYNTDYLLNFVNQIQSFKKIRAIGSASLMLTNVADGVFDAYFEKDIYLWDVAAGLALVLGSGGKVYFKRREGTFKYEVLATNSFIHLEAKAKLL